MKLLTAVLRPDCLEAVHEALDRSEARVMSATPVVDDHFSTVTYRGVAMRQARARLRVEVVVLNDLAVPDAVDAIARAALPEEPGDGFVLVTPLDDVIRLPRAQPLPPPAPDDRADRPGRGSRLPHRWTPPWP